jgi:ferric-dicitrate binding protein FerR (iron transport regulator)
VTAGSVEVHHAHGEPVARLAAGDALRMTSGGGEQLSAVEPAELLVWRLQADGAPAAAPAPRR